MRKFYAVGVAAFLLASCGPSHSERVNAAASSLAAQLEADMSATAIQYCTSGHTMADAKAFVKMLVDQGKLPANLVNPQLALIQAACS